MINRYAAVVSVDGADRLTVDNAADFSAGDTVLVIQMKGAMIIAQRDGPFGDMQEAYSVGKYEFILVDSKAGNQLIFRANLKNSYDALGKAQVVRVPGYNKARVTSNVVPVSWDPASGKGGVVALIAGNTLILNDTILASGTGFRGGAVGNFSRNECSAVDSNKYNNYYFPAGTAWDSAGYKGEGFVSYIVPGTPFGASMQLGKGRLYNGGGGGNAKFSGGGGGGSFGAGGRGGNESKICPKITLSYFGGVEGKNFKDEPKINYENSRRIFMGGGGGGGTQFGANQGTAGGHGGGLIIILADTIQGTSTGIVSRGNNVTQAATANGSGGGGGAGGSIILDVTAFKGTNIGLRVGGGNGGSTSAPAGQETGPGGGGGGGLIWHSLASLPGGVTTSVTAGIAGTAADYMGAGPGSVGGVVGGLQINLTGFLFNSVSIKRSNDTKDIVCEGEIPGEITGSQPRGGITPYTYAWEWSDNLSTWNAVAGANQRNYTPSAPLLDTIHYRRIVTDNSGPAIVDISKPVTFIMQPKIVNNDILVNGKAADTICYNQAPVQFVQGLLPLAGGNGTDFSYQWQDSPDNVTFTDIPGANSLTYQASALTATRYYRRIVSSGIGCPVVSNVIRITVLPLITNNIIGSDQVICEGSQFAGLTGSSPGGGLAGDKRYKWQESANGTVWTDAYGTYTTINYSPDTASAKFPNTVPVQFRRIVYSGPSNVCTDISGTVLLTQWPRIRNNIIPVDQVICEGDIPAAIIGNQPAGGNDSYTYQWEDSVAGSGIWQVIPAATGKDLGFTAPLADTTFYHRRVSSDVCTDLSVKDTVRVHPSIKDYNITTLSGLTDTILCNGQVPNLLVQGSTPVSGGNGVYTYLWEFNNGAGWNAAGATTATYSPPALNQTTRYRRQVFSGQCSETSNEITITVLPDISGNTLPANRTICSETQTTLDAAGPAGGSGTYVYLWEASPDDVVWNAAPGLNTQEDYTTQALTAVTYFRRKVWSGPAGCCQNVSASVRVDIWALPTANISDPAAGICTGSAVNHSISLTGAPPWNLVITDGTTDYPVNNIPASPHTAPLTATTGQQQQNLAYTLKSLVDNNGCVAKFSGLTGVANVTVYGQPVAEAGPDQAECGLVDTLKAVPGAFGSGLWTFPPQVTNPGDAANPGKIVVMSDEGTYTFTWTVTNGMCATADQAQITFWKNVSQVTLPASVTVKPSTTDTVLTAIVASPVVGTFLWTTEPDNGLSIGSPAAAQTNISNLRYEHPFFYHVNFRITNGLCFEDYPVVIHVRRIDVSVAISPNGDGLNDIWGIDIPLEFENELIILNRWGNVVFRERDFLRFGKLGWDGKDMKGRPLPDDTYYFIITFGGNFPAQKGYILIRGSGN